MPNIPLYKTLIAVVCTAIVGIGLFALYLTLFGSIMPREFQNSITLFLTGSAISVTCLLIGRLYLRCSKDESKYYYHTLWTGGWSVAVVMLVLVTLFMCMA